MKSKNNLMKEHSKIRKLSRFHSSITTVISVSLVLLLLGMVSLLGVSAHRVSENIKENLGFDVVVSDEASPEDIANLNRIWRTAPYAKSVKYISREAALAHWERETGEDLIAVLGVNPLSAEFEVCVKAQWANSDSLAAIERRLKAIPAIDAVEMHRDVADRLNANINQISMVLLVMAVALIIISIGLINNTVRLAVYARRFLIHTMKLVGATPGFIRRPFVLQSMVNGLIAACIAMLLLTATLYYVMQFEAGWREFFTLQEVDIVFGLMVVVGVLICSVAAIFAANRYIRIKYDELYTK